VTQILAILEEEFNRWEELLASLSDEQITAPHSPSDLSIKDVIAHLHAWQKISIARLKAAQLNQEPELPGWLAGSDPESEAEIDQFNARIFEAYQQQPWSRVHQAWRDGFLLLLRLGQEIPEDDLLDTDKYPWLKGYTLMDVLQGSLEHHQEHFEWVAHTIGGYL